MGLAWNRFSENLAAGTAEQIGMVPCWAETTKDRSAQLGVHNLVLFVRAGDLPRNEAFVSC